MQCRFTCFNELGSSKIAGASTCLANNKSNKKKN